MSWGSSFPISAQGEGGGKERQVKRVTLLRHLRQGVRSAFSRPLAANTFVMPSRSLGQLYLACSRTEHGDPSPKDSGSGSRWVSQFNCEDSG